MRAEFDFLLYPALQADRTLQNDRRSLQTAGLPGGQLFRSRLQLPLPVSACCPFKTPLCACCRHLSCLFTGLLHAGCFIALYLRFCRKLHCIPSGPHAAPVTRSCKLLRHQIDHKLSGFLNDIMRIPLRPDGDRDHRRIRADRPGPCDRYNVWSLPLPGTAHHHRGDRIQHVAAPPDLLAAGCLPARLLRPFTGCIPARLLRLFTGCIPARLLRFFTGLFS